MKRIFIVLTILIILLTSIILGIKLDNSNEKREAGEISRFCNQYKLYTLSGNYSEPEGIAIKLYSLFYDYKLFSRLIQLSLPVFQLYIPESASYKQYTYLAALLYWYASK